MDIIYKAYIQKSVSKGSGRGKSGLMHEICPSRTHYYEDIHLYVLTDSGYEMPIGSISACGRLRCKIANNEMTIVGEQQVLELMGSGSCEEVMVHRQGVNSWFYINLPLSELKSRVKKCETADKIESALWEKRPK